MSELFEIIQSNSTPRLQNYLSQIPSFKKLVPVSRGGNPTLTPLQLACFLGNLQAVKTIHKAGADVDGTNRLGKTPLHYASTFEIIKYLVEQGADVNAVDKQGTTVLSKIVWSGEVDWVRYLLDRGANITYELHTAAVRSNCPAMTRHLLNRGANVHFVRNQQTALDAAKKDDNHNVVKILEDWLAAHKWTKYQIPQGFSKQHLDDAPEYLRCKLCKNVMDTPTVVSCGHTYDYTCIAGFQKCPLCSREITHRAYNVNLGQAIAHYIHG